MTKKINRRDFIKTSTVIGLGALAGCSLRNRFDLLIKNGLVIDGSSAKAFAADLGIKQNRITAIGKFGDASADRIIDARGQIVSPGFIDIHTHTDTELLVNPRAESKIHQGVTTEVSGNCGYSPFPLNENDSRELSDNLKDRYGIDAHWQTADEFLTAVEKARPSLNYATFTGHGDLRAFVIGKNDVQPISEQLKTMQKVLAETMDAGSFGLSTGLEYAPGSYAKTPEIIELCKLVREYNGIYATHMRNEDDTVEEAIEEALKICRQSGVSLEISHLKACNKSNWYKVDHMLEMIHNAHDKGLPVHADRYPYNAWSTGLTSFLPLWSRQGDTDDVLKRLQNPDDQKKIKLYTESRGRRIGGWDKVVISNVRTKNSEKYEGKSILECTEITGKEPFDFIRDLLIAERNRVSVIGFAMDENNLKKVLASPLVTIGSDGSAVAPYGKLSKSKPHPRFYGTFPRVLGKYAREEKIFDMVTAVKKMTAMPADKLGLKQRGYLKENYFADIVIFNPETVIDNATFTNPHRYPTGIEHVIINGKLTIEYGRHTDTFAGKVLRHSD
ncbi:MAG: amidohydrolase family protein [Candidatus Marinimicrobia bacterium]|nr:amidohydrolase family protein [Candidatus Neomarinimicrobiota bacterium]